jgi:hypothetical protein
MSDAISGPPADLPPFTQHPPPGPPARNPLDATARARVREELQRALDFVRSPIPWREGDARSERDWCAEHGIPEGKSPAGMGPRWAEEISHLANILHARLGGWPPPHERYCPDDESQMVWELLERLVRRCDAQMDLQLAAMRWETARESGSDAPWTPPPSQIVEDTQRVYHILGDVLRYTPAGFERFKTALRDVVESMLCDQFRRPRDEETVPVVLPLGAPIETDDIPESLRGISMNQPLTREQSEEVFRWLAAHQLPSDGRGIDLSAPGGPLAAVALTAEQFINLLNVGRDPEVAAWPLRAADRTIRTLMAGAARNRRPGGSEIGNIAEIGQVWMTLGPVVAALLSAVTQRTPLARPLAALRAALATRGHTLPELLEGNDTAARPPAGRTNADEPSGDAAGNRQNPDGPFEPFGFRWAGKEIDFSDAPLRFRLVDALWDRSAGKPHPSREVSDVMAELYPDDDEADDKLKDLAKQTRKAFERSGMALTVRTSGGKLWLAPLAG